MAYGIFRKITALEFLQHHFAKSGHGDLLMTRQLISTVRQPPLHYLTRSVRRTGGFVLAANTATLETNTAKCSAPPRILCRLTHSRPLGGCQTWFGLCCYMDPPAAACLFTVASSNEFRRSSIARSTSVACRRKMLTQPLS